MPRAYHHIKSRHGPMLEELNEFWKNQIEQSSSSLLAAAATAAEETAAAAAAARQSGPITITVDDSQDITTDSEPDQDCELLAVVTKPRANRHRRSLPGPNSTTHPENPITIEDPEDMDVDTPDQDHSLRVVAEEQESQMDGSILQVPMTMDTKPEQVGNDQLTRMIATSIAIDSLPMSILDTTLVKSLVALSNPRAVVPSLAAVESALSLSYVKMSAAAKLAILEANISLGSFTADIWKSQQGKMFLGLTFHYLTSDFEPQTVPIGIKLLEDFLDPESIKLIIDDVLHDWSLIDKVFCGTTDEGILKGVTDPVFQQRDRRITGIACTCHKIQLCINNALEECKDAGTALERFHNFHQLLGRGFKHLVQPPSSSASSASPSQGGGDQKQQRQQQQEQKDPQTQQQNEHEHEHEQAKNERLGFNFLWNPPTTYCKSWANGGEGRLYWCNLYLLVRGHTYNVLTATEKMTSGAVVDLQAKEKLKQAAVKTEDMETMRNVLLVLQPVFDLWTWVSGYSGGNPGGGGDNHHHHHHHSQESTTSSDHGSSSSGTGTGSAGKKDQVYYISKVYPVIHNLIQAEMPVTHPIAEALRLALLKRLKGEWSLDHIPDPVLMATFLDPCTAGHAIFDSTVERNHIKNDLLSYTKSLIVKAVQQTVDRRSDPPVYAFDHEANVTDSGNTNSSSPSVVSMNVEAEFVVFFSTLLQDRPENLWDDPRSWWQRHTSAMPLLSSVARNCFSIQATSLPPAQLFDGAQGAESILADPRGHTNEYKFIRLLTVRNLHKFLHGDSASQLDVANVLQ
ncbi:hypothetical protein BGX31_009178 [Mortierella sp. GBA43]|nr:hypothetical protein BGX31_009178 [Mortierella sp. GBA43]